MTQNLRSGAFVEADASNPPDPHGEGWGKIGGQFSCPWLTPASWGPDRIDLFGIAGTGNAGSVWHKDWNGSHGWEPPGQVWVNIGGSFRVGTVLSVTSWGKNVLDVFGIGADGAVWHKAWRGGGDWDPPGTGWASIGGNFSKALGISAVSWGPDRIDLFGLGADGAVWYKDWNGSHGWEPPGQVWVNIGGSFRVGTVLSVTSWGKNVLDVFGIGADGAVWHKAWRGGGDWDPPGAGWASIGGNFSKALGISAVSWGPDRIDLFGLGADGGVWHKDWNGGHGWEPPSQDWNFRGGSFALFQFLALVSRRPGTLDVTGIAGGNAWSKGWYGGPDWDPTGLGWAYLGGDFEATTSLATVSWGPARIDLFGLALDGSAWHRASTAPAAPSSNLGQEFTINLGIPVGEVQAAVSPPHEADPRMVVFSTAGGNPDWLLLVPLGQNATLGQNAIDKTEEISTYSGFAKGVPGAAPGGDSQVYRLPNGDLITSRQAGFIMALSPEPGWWNEPNLPKPGYRVGLVLWTSQDRGKTWGIAPRSIIDSAQVAMPYTDANGNVRVEIGRCAWPQFDTNQGKYGPGGWDRQGICVDAFSDRAGGTVYAAVHSESGSGEKYSGHWTYKTLLFASLDGAKTWVSDSLGHPRPLQALDECTLEMTTTSAGLFFAFADVGSVPTLWISSDGGNTVKKWEVYYGGTKTPETIVWGAPPSTIPGQLRNAAGWGVSRAGDGLRIVYSSRNVDDPNARQIARVIFVRFPDPNGPPEIHNVAEITPQDPNGHILYPTFIETDRVELPRDNPSDAAMLYWVETSGDQIRTRYSLFHGTLGWSQPQDLSSSSWRAVSSFDIGDYMKGAFFYDGQLNFLAQWPQVRDAQGNPVNQIRYRILTVQPSA